MTVLVDLGVNPDEAANCLLGTGNSLENSIPILLKKDFSYMDNYFKSITKTEYSLDNLFINLSMFLIKMLENCTNYCMICYKKHIQDSFRIRPCDNPFCEFRYF